MEFESLCACMCVVCYFFSLCLPSLFRFMGLFSFALSLSRHFLSLFLLSFFQAALFAQKWNNIICSCNVHVKMTGSFVLFILGFFCPLCQIFSPLLHSCARFSFSSFFSFAFFHVFIHISPIEFSRIKHTLTHMHRVVDGILCVCVFRQH